MFGGSWKLARIFGIDVLVHWSFPILIVYVVFSALTSGATLTLALVQVALVLCVFVCIVMHEYGHALTARQFGIRTREITLLPFGGLAQLEKMPDKPWQELLVAVAGPAVNVVIAAVLAGVLFATAGIKGVTDIKWIAEGVPGFLAQLMAVNIFLILFNAIPAFPMDGGRVLRSVLAMFIDHVQATKIAATIGRVVAVGFGIYALIPPIEPFLILIAFFIFTAAGGESRYVQTKALLAGARVRDVMATEFRSVTPLTRISDLAQAGAPGGQQDYPVVEGELPVGMVYRALLLVAITHGKQDQNVGSIMKADCGSVRPDDPLQGAIEQMQATGYPTLPVIEHDRLVGLISAAYINDWMRMQAAQRQAGKSGNAIESAVEPT